MNQPPATEPSPTAPIRTHVDGRGRVIERYLLAPDGSHRPLSDDEYWARQRAAFAQLAARRAELQDALSAARGN